MGFSYSLLSRRAPTNSWRRNEGFGSTNLFPLQVFPFSESEIAAPIELAPPIDLTVSIQPPTDPLGEAWRLQLLEVGLGAGTLRSLDQGRTANGRWKRTQTEPAEYLVKVMDSSGSVWYSSKHEVDTDRQVVEVQLPIVAVEGVVTLGDEPLEAELWFGGRYGHRRLRTKSDQEGLYRILIPEGGAWAVAIQAASPSVNRTLRDIDVPEMLGGDPAQVDLRLPDTRIFGKVLDENMFPVVNAIVTVIDYERLERPSSTRTDKSGSFDFVGLGPGEMQVFAVAGDLRSDEEAVDLDDDRAHHRLFLSVTPGDKISGTLSSAIGPIPGAMLTLTPEGRPNGHQRITDVRGQFTVRVPSETRALDFVALPPGLPFTAGRTLIQSGSLSLDISHQSGSLLLQGGLGALAEAVSPGDSLLLFHGPVVIDPALLVEWVTMQRSLGHDTGDENLAILPNFGTGEYRACVIPRAERLRFVVDGTPPTRCVSTFVPVGGAGSLDLRSLTARGRSQA